MSEQERGQSPVFIGDELSALGYRRAGARTVVPGDGELLTAFEQACSEAPVVLITAGLAAQLPERRLRQAQRSVHPLLLVVPDVQNLGAMPNAGKLVRRQLGMET